MPSRKHPTSKTQTKSPLFPRRKLLRVGLGCFGVCLVLLLILIALVHWGLAGPVPSSNALSGIRQAQATEVISADGKILGKYYLQNRVMVTGEEISPWVSKALVATEDSRFFNHRGIDVIGLARVLFRTLLTWDKRQGGGSTLSQQLAKNLYPRKYNSWWMMPAVKVREMLIARRLEKVYDKSALLNLYLNTVPFGDDIYGIEVASRRYFSKPAVRLDVHEAALLVGMLKGNSYYHPVRQPDRALDRRNTVIHRLEEKGDLTRTAAKSYAMKPLELRYSRESQHEGLAPHFREHLRVEVDSILHTIRKSDGTPYDLYSDGLRIYTTINAAMQRIAEDAMAVHLVTLQSAFDKEWKNGKPWGDDKVLEQAMKFSPRWKTMSSEGYKEEAIRKAFREPVDMQIFTWQGAVHRKWSPMDSLKYTLSLLHAGILAGDPHSGEILVWVGGISHRFFQYDQVKARRPFGSTFKPLVYAAALEAGFDPCDYFEDKEVNYPEYQDWTPRNASGTSAGYYTMAGALSHSVNTVAAALIMETGIESVREMAKRCGIQSSLPTMPSIALGVADISLLEALTMYGVFAREGRIPSWYYIDRIEDHNGNLIFATEKPRPDEATQVLEPEHAYALRYALEMAVDSGTATALRHTYGIKGSLAAKTGTTQDHADGWLAAFGPGLVAVSRVGATLPSVHFRTLRQGAGARTALPLIGRLWAGCQKSPELTHYVNRPFNPLPEEVLMALDCPPWLAEMPDIADNSPDLWEILGFRDSDADSTLRSPSEAWEKMEKQRKKREKQQSRKEAWDAFWDKVLGR